MISIGYIGNPAFIIQKKIKHANVCLFFTKSFYCFFFSCVYFTGLGHGYCAQTTKIFPDPVPFLGTSTLCG